MPAPMSPSDSAPASSVRALGPIQPRETAMASRNAMPATTATPPVQARIRPPSRSSRSKRSRGLAGAAAAGDVAGGELDAGAEVAGEAPEAGVAAAGEPLAAGAE